MGVAPIRVSCRIVLGNQGVGLHTFQYSAFSSNCPTPIYTCGFYPTNFVCRCLGQRNVDVVIRGQLKTLEIPSVRSDQNDGTVSHGILIHVSVFSIIDNALILAADTDLIGRIPFKHGLYWSHDMVTRRTNLVT
jgi:hypothetical protein